MGNLGDFGWVSEVRVANSAGMTYLWVILGDLCGNTDGAGIHRLVGRKWDGDFLGEGEPR